MPINLSFMIFWNKITSRGSQMEKLTILKSERINSIDAMRGFAIFGIFLTNMLAFHSPILYIDPYEWWDTKIDHTIYGLIDFFVQASFYPLFALLFGFGLMIIRERTFIRDISFTPISLRRLSLLLLIGCLHAFFVWHGDILITYAICGSIALLFLRLSGKILISIGLISYLIPNLLLTMLMFVASLLSPTTEYHVDSEAYKSVLFYQTGSFMEITSRRYYDWSMVNGLEGFVVIFFSIFPLIIIGAGIAKLNLIKNEITNKRRFKLFLVVFLVLGSALKLLPFIWRNLFTEFVQDIFGGPLLSISYAILMILLMEKFATYLTVFQSVGKLAISNYLFQSIVSTFIFYNYGLGLYNQISVTTGTILAIGIFILQACISMIWVRKFNYGPIEWIWRAFTYWKKPKWNR
jgi:uncharacterized protein